MAGSFSISLANFQVKTEKQMKLACQKIAMEAWRRVIEKSPVDTGRFRANWGCQVGSPYAGFDESTTDKTGAKAIANSIIKTASWNAKGSIFLNNNASYAIILERGHSKQAPFGMVRLTVAEMQNGAAESALKGGM